MHSELSCIPVTLGSIKNYLNNPTDVIKNAMKEEVRNATFVAVMRDDGE